MQQLRKLTTKRQSDDCVDLKNMKQKKLITVSDIPICTEMVRTGFISLNVAFLKGMKMRLRPTSCNIIQTFTALNYEKS